MPFLICFWVKLLGSHDERNLVGGLLNLAARAVSQRRCQVGRRGLRWRGSAAAGAITVQLNSIASSFQAARDLAHLQLARRFDRRQSLTSWR